MKHAIIVDNEADALAADFAAVATRLNLQIRFTPTHTPEELLQDLKTPGPDFILLHHTWPGLKISKLLDNLREKAPSTHVIVFTGQSVKIDELIECVRGGVTDYWRKGEFDSETMVRKIAMDIEDRSMTLEKLHLSSGSIRKLLIKAEQINKEAADIDRRNQELENKIRGGQPEVFKDIMGVVKYVVYVAALTICVIAINRNTHLQSWQAVAVVALIAITVLFLERAIKYAFLKIDRHGMSLESRTEAAPTRKPPK